MQRLAETLKRQGLHMIFKIRRQLRWIRTCKGTELGRCHRHRAAAVNRILHADAHLAEPVIGHRVQGFHALYLECHAQLQMVLQVFSDTARIDDGRDTVLLQQWRRPDAGQLQDLWRTDRAGGQQRFLRTFRTPFRAATGELDTGTAPALVGRFNAQALHMATGHDVEIATPYCRLQKRPCGIQANTAALIHFEITAAFIVAAVEIIRHRYAALLCSHTKGIEDFP